MLLHERNKQQLDMLVSRLPHSLLVVGPEGSGKIKLVEYFTCLLTDLKYTCKASSFDASGLFGIEDIRSLWRQLAHKPRLGKNLHLIIICHSENLRVEAQTALLKTLEEPPSNTLLVLLAHNEKQLLPTIRSRMSLLQIIPPTMQQYVEHHSNVNIETINKAYLITDGWYERMTAFINNDSNTEYMEYIGLAKELLSQSIFQRLGRVDELTKQKSFNITTLLETLVSICRAACKATIVNKETPGSTSKIWLERTSNSLCALDDIAKGGNSKIILTDLFLRI